MTFRVFLRTVALGLTVSVIVPFVLAQQSGQTGSGTGNSNGRSNNTSNATGNPMDSGSRAQSNTRPDSQSQLRRQQYLFISGFVVLDDGTPPPLGTVIERDCGGKTTRETYVGPNGGFGYQVGANNYVLPDASDAGQDSRWTAGGLPSSSFPEMGSSPMAWLTGCELRAQIGGYRSSTVLLTVSQTMGILDVGTIVLYPAVRVPGTTVSVTNLAAPKEAKKALERAEKAIQKKKLDEAEQDLQAALKSYPKYATAWFRLGEVYEQSHRTEEGRNAFSKALAADGNYVNPYIELARLAALETKWQDTADLTGRALELDPIDFVEGYYLNSLANYNLNKLDAAEKSARQLERLDSLHHLPQAYLLLASIFNRRQDSAGEADQLRNFLKYAPQSPKAGQVRSRLQDLEKGNPGPQAVRSKEPETAR